mgnify:CR=1 FL=1
MYQESLPEPEMISTEMIKIAESKIDNPNIHFSTTDFYCYHETDFDEIVIFDAYPHFIEIDKFKNSLLSSLKSGGRVYIIHDISRKELNKHHANHAAGVSRMIKDPVNEAKIYEDKFNIIKAEEGDDYYHLFMEKKYE